MMVSAPTLVGTIPAAGEVLHVPRVEATPGVIATITSHLTCLNSAITHFCDKPTSLQTPSLNRQEKHVCYSI